MTDQLNCQLSAFVDDALTEEESELLVRRLCRDPELRNTMARYALIGDAFRGGEAATPPAEFSRRVMMRIEGQPVPVSAVSPVRKQRTQFGLAVAASVVLAAVALMTLPGRAPAPDAGPAQTAGIEQPAASEMPVVTLVELPVPQQAPDTNARLNNYLVQHVSATGAGRGPIAYRNVGYRTETEARR